MSDISIMRLPLIGMIGLRGELAALEHGLKSVTGCAVPEIRLSTKSDGYRLMWMSPDELLLICEADLADGLVSDLQTRFKDLFVTVTNISSARQVFEIRGEGAESLLANVMPVDFAKLQSGEVRRTRMAQVPAAIWQHDGAWRLMCFRSVADYTEGLLQNAKPVRA